MYDSYDGLIFDMDGTLIDTEPTHRKAWKITFEKYSISYDVDSLCALNGSPTLHIAQAIVQNLASPISPETLAKEKTALVHQLLLENVQTLPLISVVKSWYGKRPLALGTGSSRVLTEALLRQLDLKHYFNAIVTADDVLRHKPAPDTFLRCAALLNVAPERCVVFEDADFGIQAARQAGMDVVDVRLL